jgi:hypothetical protein
VLRFVISEEGFAVYMTVLVQHSWLRWIVLAIGVIAAVRAWVGWQGRRPWTPTDTRTGRIFGIAADVQFVLGLVLYAVLSPMTKAAFGAGSEMMRNPQLRFWAVEHVALMVLAVASIHVGQVLSRRATADPARHRRAALFFTLACILALAGIPWPGGPNARPLFRI